MADTGIRAIRPAGSAVCGTEVSRRKLSLLRLGELAQSTADAEHAWRPVVRFRPHERWFHRLDLTEDYEIWLLSWLPGQHTGFHDHGDAHGAFAVADGELRETLAAPGSRRIVERVARHRSVTRFGRRHLHDVGNVTLEPAVSVHVYSPPLSAMRRYQMTDTGLELVATDRAEQDW